MAGHLYHFRVMNEKTDIKGADPFISLRSLTAARIMLGRTGASLPLHEMQNLKLAHARARDAIYASWDPEAFGARLGDLVPIFHLVSMAKNREQYLLQPPLGRQLSNDSRMQLRSIDASGDICILVGDGLSPQAVDRYAKPFLDELIPMLREKGFSITPLCTVRQARVAIADEVGLILGARSTIMLIGERPGLSAWDSMGLYYTYDPKPGRTDAQRNCISNIRKGGLDTGDAVSKACSLIQESFRLGLSGVNLKDNAGVSKNIE